jgi:hypothetical protein
MRILDAEEKHLPYSTALIAALHSAVAQLDSNNSDDKFARATRQFKVRRERLYRGSRMASAPATNS